MSGAIGKAAEDGTSVQWVPGHPSGPMYFFDITRPISEQLDWLVQQNPDYILTFPSTLRALLQRAEKMGIDLPRLSQVSTMSEVLHPDVPDACARIWGAKVVDSYSSQEVGIAAMQCPDHPHYHIQSEQVLLEVLDADDKPCGPGEVGRVVVTSLHNFATPLIRYEIGDHAKVGEPCPCGRGLPVLKRVLGRSRNMAILPSGDQIWPIGYFSESLMPIAPVRQIQFIQNTVHEIDVKLVVSQALTGTEETALRDYIVECLSYEFTINLQYVDEVPRSPSGKYEDFICRVDPATVPAMTESV